MRQWLMREWRTAFLLVLVVMQTIIMWIHTKKTRKDVRSAILPYALLAVAIAIIIVREIVGNIPDQLDWGLLIPVVILLLLASWLMLAQAKRHLQDVGLMEKKKN